MPVAREPDPATLIAALVTAGVLLSAHAWLAVRALRDLDAARGRCRVYPEATWRLLIVLVGIVGPLAYLAFGRDDAG